MAKADYYTLLGVSKGCDDKELKSAFRKLAMECHPDRHPDDEAAEQRFKEINEAYEILKDPQKRSAYDQFGHAAFERGNGGAGFGGFPGGGGFSDIFEDIFGEMMGGGRGRRGSGRERGADLRYNMEITLEEAYAGKNAEISRSDRDHLRGLLRHAAPSPAPRPSHAPPAADRAAFAPHPASSRSSAPARPARAAARSSPIPAANAAARAASPRERSLSVNIPAGIEDGIRIRLAGEGEAGARGGPAGDLYIFLSVKPHEFFQRDGADLFCRVPISMMTAALGGQFEVSTLDGTKVQIKVPEGTPDRPTVPPQGQGHAGDALAKHGRPLHTGR